MEVMMSANWVRLSVLTALLMVVVPESSARDLSAGLEKCRAEKDDTRRLACYDGLSAEPGDQLAKAGAETADTPKSSEEQFGYEGALAREESDRAKEEARGLGRLEATVTGISTRGDNTLVVTLDNGQVWTQNRPDAFFRLKVGEKISIEPGVLGSFLMISPHKRTARVSRQK
jgi:hypothetical protein